MKSFALATALTVMGCTLGCGGPDQVTGIDDTTSGQRCLWAESRPDLTFPVCPAPQTSEFMGTIDGKPYHTQDSGDITAMTIPVRPPYTISMKLAGSGSLDLTWWDPYIRGQWVNTVSGFILLPEEDGKARAILPYSELLFSCDDYSFLYILHIYDTDLLTGCSR